MPGLATALIAWYRHSRRDLPWRRTRDPWRILVSEVMLQQTRVQTVVPYYERFFERFPDVGAFAHASEQDVLAAWAGLGYYSRVRNLQRAARAIVEAGAFPASYESLRELPGVGDYTAAAVASIAFGFPHAAVDGNVLRVISRLMNDAADIASPSTRARFAEIADELLDGDDPGDFNQGMMELGATVCLPRNPACLLCPMSMFCDGFAAGRQHQLPIKSRPSKTLFLDRTLLLISRQDSLLMRRQNDPAKRMAGFWELPEPEHVPQARITSEAGEFRHTITHHRFRFRVMHASVKRAPEGFEWLDAHARATLPVSTIARKALRLAKIDRA
jgi:A/G-specific adenine glycosylase